MKHQQVVVDYWTMIKTSFTCLLLAFAGYVLIKMVQTIFWLPGHLKSNQKRLEDLAAQYKIDLNKLDDDIKFNREQIKSVEAKETVASDDETKKDL